MAFNRKPEKQILQQHRFEEFNQNSISKLISLRSTTHWHVLAESEQLQIESWNNTLSGPLAAGPHRVGAWGPLACHLLMLDHVRSIEEGLTYSILQVWVVTAAAVGVLRLGAQLLGGGSQKGRVARELAQPQGKSLQSTAGLFWSPRGVPNSNDAGKNQVKNLSMRPNTCWG